MPPYRLYYADGSVYEDDPFFAPGRGLLALIAPNADGAWHVVSDCHHYVWCPMRGWFGCGKTDVMCTGLNDYLFGPDRGPKAAVAGVTAADEIFNAVMQRATTDAEAFYGRKSAITILERFLTPRAQAWVREAVTHV